MNIRTATFLLVFIVALVAGSPIAAGVTPPLSPWKVDSILAAPPPHDWAGPDQNDTTKFRPFQDSEIRDMWTYHAVAAILRGHSLLISCAEVNAERIGITGISWGGYLTCITAGVDSALKAAVPVYGCGYCTRDTSGTHSPSPSSEPSLSKAHPIMLGN